MALLIFALLIVVFVVLPLVGYAFWLVLSTAVVGLVIGALARLVVPGRHRLGLLLTMAIGIAGALVGSILGKLLPVGGVGTFLLQVAVAATGVAVVSGSSRALPGRSGRSLGR